MIKGRNGNRITVHYTSDEVVDLPLDFARDKDIGDAIISNAYEDIGLNDPGTGITVESSTLSYLQGRFSVTIEIAEE